jgi:hypothetical protein
MAIAKYGAGRVEQLICSSGQLMAPCFRVPAIVSAPMVDKLFGWCFS